MKYDLGVSSIRGLADSPHQTDIFIDFTLPIIGHIYNHTQISKLR